MNKNIFFLLVAEDDLDDRELLRYVLDQEFPQWQYHIATNGQNLLNYLANRSKDLPPVSLIMLDINMPIKDGVETVQELRMNPVYNYIPIVGFSTSSDQWVINRFMTAGGSGYFQKPNDLDHISLILLKIAVLAND